MLTRERVTPGRLLLGLVLAGVGALVVIDEMGWASSRTLLERWWPVIPIPWGLYQLANSRRFWLVPALVTGAGVVLLFSLDWLTAEFGDLVWAGAIILTGLLIAIGLLPARDLSTPDEESQNE